MAGEDYVSVLRNHFICVFFLVVLFLGIKDTDDLLIKMLQNI
jgi:hypothetical protein